MGLNQVFCRTFIVNVAWILSGDPTEVEQTEYHCTSPAEAVAAWVRHASLHGLRLEAEGITRLSVFDVCKVKVDFQAETREGVDCGDRVADRVNALVGTQPGDIDISCLYKVCMSGVSAVLTNKNRYKYAWVDSWARELLQEEEC